MDSEELLIGEKVDKKKKIFFIDQLVVIPAECISLESQMKNITIDGKHGSLVLSPEDIKNVNEVENLKMVVPYVIYDIEDGNVTAGMNPIRCRDYFPKYRRRGLTAAEGIALVRRYPTILKYRDLQLIDSYYHDTERCIILYMSHDGPKMDYDHINDIYANKGKFGTPSCRWIL